MGHENTLWHVTVFWVDGTSSTVVLDSTDLEGLNWDTWINNFLIKAGTRPTWFQMGDLTFHSQNVRSIRLNETIEKED